MALPGNFRLFVSHTSDLDVSPDGGVSFVGVALRAIAALPGFTVEEQGTTFEAEDEPAAAVCSRRLEACDIYVGIVGTERGSKVLADAAGRSFVELEFDLAGDFGMPRIVLVWEPGPQGNAPLASEQRDFRRRLASTEEIIFARFGDRGELRSALERALLKFQPETAEHVSCHVEWATPTELSANAIGPGERRWAVYVRNPSTYPAYDVLVTVRSNNGGPDCDIDFGVVPPLHVVGSSYILNLELESFDPFGDRPAVEMGFTIAGVRWQRRADGSLSRRIARRS